ncbi:MAG: hypothetical protein HRF49_07850 [bacterium]|jgi:hypothetical protein
MAKIAKDEGNEKRVTTYRYYFDFAATSSISAATAKRIVRVPRDSGIFGKFVRESADEPAYFLFRKLSK